MFRMRRNIGTLLLLLATAQVQADNTAIARAQRIDACVEAAWPAGVVPAPLADDAEFLRRVSLDLNGCIPRAAEVVDFLDDAGVDKRHQTVEVLLRSPRYTIHFTNVWRTALLSQSAGNVSDPLRMQLDAWLRGQLQHNRPYDAFVRELLVTELIPKDLVTPAPTPRAFYQANEYKPENLAASASRLFLGINLDCAQCHNHPFAAWTQDQFWQFAAFFGGIQTRGSTVAEVFDRKEIKIAGTERLATAKFLDGREPVWQITSRPRALLADWLTSAKNPYFAKAAANRVWSHFFGRGLVEPLDQIAGPAKPSHPELLDELARILVEERFDIRPLIRAILLSQAYQRTSRQTHPSQAEPARFARAVVRGLSPEQVFDSLALATGYFPDGEDATSYQALRRELIVRFATLDRPADAQSTIVQALTLMNSRFIGSATNPAHSRTVSALLEAPHLNDRRRVEMLYLATLSRFPTSEEREQVGKIFKHNGEGQPIESLLSDVFWALLNSGEFILNH
jgi:hypothetical protein